MTSRNARRHNRKDITASIRIGWHDKSVVTRSFDISQSGLRFELFERLPLRTDVMLRGDRIGLQTRAIVRYCEPKGAKFAIGVEFAGGYRWSPPNEEVRRALEEAEMLAV